MKLFPGLPNHQRVIIAVMFGAVSVYALAQQKEQVARITSLRLNDPKPRVVDGDTLEVSGSRIRIVGIDAPDDDRLRLKQLSTLTMQGLVDRDGGVECATSLFDFALRREKQCRSPATSYGRLNLSCRFKANEASVAATMVAQGYAVDYRRYSGGAYVKLMQRAAEQRLGLWGQDYEGMRQLAIERATLPKGCEANSARE
ncbi:MAG: thermonuclease family protein [Kaiparowitsia implicata GSE-PSE-MK54-09C]|jgi:endonuclease YncB( thermonuclease family)|nr:thermonuclease family protein [Kaiparowitsia implicata GSE-PSE-MK54-09C]